MAGYLKLNCLLDPKLRITAPAPDFKKFTEKSLWPENFL
jgi:hypothetical protein